MWPGIPPMLSVSVTPHSFGVLIYGDLARMHRQRVLADGGVIDDYQALKDAVITLQRIYGSRTLTLKLAAAIDPAIFGYKFRTDATGTWCVKAYSLMGAASDVVQATASAQPLLLRYSGEKYAYFPDAASNFISTPDAAANKITGDIEIIVKASLPTWTSRAVNDAFLSKGLPSFGYLFQITSTGKLTLFLSANGTSFSSSESTIAVPFSNNEDGWVKVTWRQSDGRTQYFTGGNGNAPVWVQLGTDRSLVIASIFNNNNNLVVGSWGATNNPLLGSIYYASVSPIIGGAPTAEFNAEDYDISVSQSTLTSSATGETWQLNRSTATSGYKAQLVYRTTMQGDGVDDFMSVVFSVSEAQPNTSYATFDQLSWLVNRHIVSFDNMAAAYMSAQSPVSPNLVARAGAAEPNQSYTGESLNKLAAYMCQMNGVNSILSINGAYSPIAMDTNVIAGVRFFDAGGAAKGNAIINTLIVSKNADDLATRNLINTLVRSWNGNPLP